MRMLSTDAGGHRGDTDIGAGNLHSLCWDEVEAACHRSQEYTESFLTRKEEIRTEKGKEAEKQRTCFQGEKLTIKKT